MGKHRRMLHLPVEKDALVGHEDIVKDDESFRRVMLSGEGKIPRVLVTRCIGRIDDPHPWGIHGHHGADGIGLFPRLHSLGGNGHQFVAHGGRGDMELRAPKHHPLIVAGDDAYIGVRVVLLPWAAAPVAFGIGDALGNAHIVSLRLLHPGADARRVLRHGFTDAIGGGQQGHDGGVGDVGQQIHRFVELDLGPKRLGVFRHLHKSPNSSGPRIKETIIAIGGGIHRLPQQRVGGDILHPLPLKVCGPTIAQRGPVLLPGHHRRNLPFCALQGPMQVPLEGSAEGTHL